MKHISSHIVLLVSAALAIAGCGRISDELDALKSELASLSERVLEIENTRVQNLEQRLAAVKDEISLLQKSDNVRKEDIDALEEEVKGISSDLSAAKESVASLNGTSEELSAEVEKINSRIAQMSSDIKNVLAGLSELNARVDALKGMVAISHIPTYLDKTEIVLYTRDSLKISGNVTLKFDMRPESAAATIAGNFRDYLSVRALQFTGSGDGAEGDGDFIDLDISGASAEDGVLSVAVSTDRLNRDFIFGTTKAAVSVKVSLGDSPVETKFINLSTKIEEKALVTYLLTTFDSDGDGQVNDMDKVTTLNLSGYGLSNIGDILYTMSSLEVLDCSDNAVKSLDLSRNPALTTLDVSGNASLAVLDITQNAALTSLDASNTALASLDASNSPSLSSLNISGVSAIGSLNVSGTALTALDISTNGSLTALDYTEGLTITSGFSAGRYIKANGVEGVVYYASGTTAKIVSTDEVAKSWPDGQTWCQEKGTVWSMPSLEDLKTIYNNLDKINGTLNYIYIYISKRAAVIAGPGAASTYWADDLFNISNAYYFNFTDGSVPDAISTETNKSYFHVVRAVRTL